PVVRHNYRVGVPEGGFFSEILNTDAEEYGGSGVDNKGGVTASNDGWNYRSHSLSLTLPPLATIVLSPSSR
ncbi:MAG: alpha amylase C-terminal domain-containing protein, partial [Alphaproteobacteria bacterium]|nr:alpha amylase C-terminal domain-containing protein [Alphaproteobacteria bacterium]